ncbi:UMTA methyltransferase family protein [Cordyceps militaris CM01]|uniref:UMTA methyltransferase family protein n=1 Tax=Cordyceps militaris (strain CM01) TaxID=983644 RepID=G3JDZ6_CORMM|nr:UMTA methyltransferase family protein [Cordyceps militaris CM01]EGX92821.1 UMTA methyltransferase family protein [Cordyceps militaris CM01]
MDLRYDFESTSDYAGSFSASEFTSVKTNRLLNLYEHGRYACPSANSGSTNLASRYQAVVADRYGLPNDEAEQLREGIKHRLYLDHILKGHHFFAPIGDGPQKIVDLGTGTGIWAMEVAEKFPSARVIGTDISAIQPSWTPPNLEYRVEDLEDDYRPWTSIYNDADLVHCRFFMQVIRDPKRMVDTIFDRLRPGGWIECHDIVAEVYSKDASVGKDHPINQLYHLIDGPFTEVYKWNLHIVLELPSLLREAGFVNVSTRRNKIPIGRWPSEHSEREMGLFQQTIILDFALAVLARHDILGLDQDEAAELGQQVVDCVHDPGMHAYMDWADVWAQKPVT